MLSSLFFLECGVVVVGGDLPWGRLADQRVCFCLAASQVFFSSACPPPLPVSTHSHSEAKYYTHKIPSIPFFRGGGVGRGGLHSSAALLPSVLCGSPTGARRLARLPEFFCSSHQHPAHAHPQCRSSGISPMEKPARNSEKARRIHVIVMELYAAA